MSGRDQENMQAFHARLFEMSSAYQISQTLYVAIRLRVFTCLSGRSLTAQEVAEAVGIHPRPAERLLNVCVALDLLEREGERYRNSPLAEQCLVEEAPGFCGHMVIRLVGEFYETWGRLEEGIRQNQRMIPYEEQRRSDPETARISTLGTYDSSRGRARLLAERLDLSGAKRLLDVGGGSGVISIALAERYPNLEALILDQPLVCEAAQELIARSPAAPRIRTRSADYNRDELPAGFDMVVLSNILHIEGAEANRRLLAKAYRSLHPGGQVVIIDLLMNDDKRGPAAAALFGLSMLLIHPEGSTYSGAEIHQWLEEVGFEGVQIGPLAGHHSLLTARRPT